MTEPFPQTLVETAEPVRRGERSAVEVLDTCLAAIARRNRALNAFVHLDEAGARQAAANIDARVARGEDPGPLAGVPFGVKDLEDCAGMPTARGSVFLKGSQPVANDFPQVARLKAAGAVAVGKTATAEYGFGSYTNTTAFGVTRNPWNLERTPGGSSGGSAAAVSAGLVPLATATDGAGSTRTPAAFTGLVGLKPSTGRIPRAQGAFVGSCPGALTVTVGDTARYLDVVKGPAGCDRGSLPGTETTYETIIETLDVAGLRAVWSDSLGYISADPEVVSIAREAAESLMQTAGLARVERQVAFTDVYMDLLALFVFGLKRELETEGILPGRIDELSPRPRELIERFTQADDSVWLLAQERIQTIEQEAAALFSEVDVLLTPATACAPFSAEGPAPAQINGRDMSETGVECFPVMANACWNPSISVPAGLTADGLPTGLLITAPRHRDDIVLRLARIFEQTRPWPRWAPG